MKPATHLIILFIVLTAALSASAQSSSVLLIHGSSDPALEVVDVWLDSTKVVDNLSFRNAEKLNNLPSNAPLRFHLCDSGSTDTSAAFLSFTEILATGSQLSWTVQGMLDPTGFSNYHPLGISAFDLNTLEEPFAGYSGLTFIHSIPDQDSIDLEETREPFGGFVNDFTYGSYSNEFELESFAYRLLIEASMDGSALGEFDMNLTNLADSNAFILLSGFRTPNENNDGPAIGVTSITKSGKAEHYEASESRIQFIHNSSDTTIEMVDVYIDGKRVVNDLSVRSASGFKKISSSLEHTVAICPDTSSNDDSPYFTSTVVGEADETSVGIITGDYDPIFSPQPTLDLAVRSSRTESNNGTFTDILFFNGVSDYGRASVFERDLIGQSIFGTIQPSEFSDYVSLPLSAYNLDLRDSSNTTTDRFLLNLEQFDLAGEAITIVSSGYRDTTSLQGIEKVGLWFARSQSGKLTKLPFAVGVDELASFDVRVYPNPASDFIYLSASSPIENYRLMDVKGRLVQESQLNALESVVDVSNLAPGIYILETKVSEGYSVKRISITGN